MKRLLVFVMVMGVIGCSDSTAPTSYLGVFTLTTINGNGLPYVVYNGAAGKFEVTYDAITLQGDGTWLEHTRSNVTQNGVTTLAADTIHGTFARSGTTVTLTESDSTTYSGLFSSDGKSLTIIYGGAFTMVFRK